jgi:hypothetical protein
MIAREYMDLAWIQAGTPTSLDPRDDVTIRPKTGETSRTTLLRYLNLAYRTISVWRDKVTGKLFRWRGHSEEVFLTPRWDIGTCDTGSSTTAVVVAVGSLTDVAEDLRGAYVTVGSETRVVISNVGITLQVDRAFSADVTGEVYTLKRKWLQLATGTNIFEVLQVNDVENRRQLKLQPEWDYSLSRYGQVGEPNQYRRKGLRVYFEQMPETQKLYQIIYHRYPEAFVLDTDESELPGAVDEALSMYLEKLIYEHTQEHGFATARYNAFVDRMRTVISEYDIESEGDANYPSKMIYE